MKLKNLFVVALFISFLAFTIQTLDNLISPNLLPDGNKGFVFISFQSWALYFLAGCNAKGGARAFLGYIVGIAASILIVILGTWVFNLKIFGLFSFPIVIFFVVIPLICLENAKKLWIDMVPAMFIGSGIFFAFVNYVPGATNCLAFEIIMFYCALGLFYGWMTVTFRTWYEKKLAQKDASKQ